ncbi:MAG: Sec-independent protein translocase protein TatB [Alphaproteobacteria bacterium]|nr:Sec-independent protein translocase protein TatB [Alphaproteobacteria bacterium]
MFDIGWSEMAIIMLLALIIIGPKDLPRVARTIGQWVRKGRMLAREFQTSLEDMAKEAELDDVKKEIEKVGKTDLSKSIENTIDPKGDLKKAFDISNGATDEDTVGKALNGGAKADAGAQSSASPPKVEAPTETPATAPAAKPAPKTASASTKAKTTTSAKKPSPRAKKPAASTAKKTAAPKARTAKKPAAPKKRTAKPASSAKPSAGDTPSSPDDGGATGTAIAAESS